MNERLFNYFGQTVSIATKHQKEEVVAPIFLDVLGVKVIRADVDTDQFGTFAGEVERKLPPLETAIAKARAAIEQSGAALGLASEGTIGPHPMLPIASSDLEIMVFIDVANDLVIHESVRSSEVVTARRVVRPGEDLEGFLRNADFPNHGLIVRAENASKQRAIKGLTDLHSLKTAIAKLAGEGDVVVETDLRANFAPSRMKLIRDCATLLAKRVASHCPRCEAPGFGSIKPIFGVPCQHCGEVVETIVAADRQGCVKCDFTETEPRAVVTAQPRFCPSCNP